MRGSKSLINVRGLPTNDLESDVEAPKFVCAGCGTRVGIDRAPFACPNRQLDDNLEHILRRVAPDLEWPLSTDPNPFIRFRRHLSAAWLGVPDDLLLAHIEQLDAAVAEVWGHGFRDTPVVPLRALEPALESLEIWAKAESQGVAGSHKARHLFGEMVYLQVLHRKGHIPRTRELAIASCGNAALAAAVIARASDWPLRVFVPEGAPVPVLQMLNELGAKIVVCTRDNQLGDPCLRAFRRFVRETSAIPFCCQGPESALCIEGGETVGLEFATQLAQARVDLDWLVIQVGGGALASACAAGFEAAVRVGLISRMPRICSVQTTGCWPLARAYHRLLADMDPDRYGQPSLADVRGFRPTDLDNVRDNPTLRHQLIQRAAHTRSRWMSPWPSAPTSTARGILDDETYDWLAVVQAMFATAGFPLVVTESQLMHAQQLSQLDFEYPADATGAAGLAGVLELAGRGDFSPGDRVGVLLTAGPASAQDSSNSMLADPLRESC